MSAPTELLLLTQPHCDYCEQAKETIAKIAREHQVAVRTIDTATPEGETLAREGGVLFPPGVFIDGEAFSYGRLSERKLRRELSRRASDH